VGYLVTYEGRRVEIKPSIPLKELRKIKITKIKMVKFLPLRFLVFPCMEGMRMNTSASGLTATPMPALTDGEALKELLQFVGEGAVARDFCGWWHTGDVRHLLSNGLRGGDSDQTLFIVKNADEQLISVIVTQFFKPNMRAFEVMIEPAFDQPARRKELTVWAEEQLDRKAQTAEYPTDLLVSDYMECDSYRLEVMQELGYELADVFMHFAARPLDDIPDSVLPEGFSIRNVQRLEEAEALARVHMGAFGSSWTAESYQKVMTTPAFEIDHELVVVAPDGRYAAFLIYWIDPVTKTGLFEPVGCHSEFQRRGLTKALMYEGMRRMHDEGANTAMVKYFIDNPAASAAYTSVGFTVRHPIREFRKKVKSEGQ
jgi:mycothiol synthase